jgi:hypothetical protein
MVLAMRIGTPENPEIIEPGGPRRMHTPSRWRIILQMLGWMISLCLPAIFFDYICFWLIEIGRGPNGFLAWVLLILFAPPAVLFTLIAVFGNLFLSLAIVLTLFGRAIALPKMKIYR